MALVTRLGKFKTCENPTEICLKVNTDTANYINNLCSPIINSSSTELVFTTILPQLSFFKTFAEPGFCISYDMLSI